jgi:hypothetical protein
MPTRTSILRISSLAIAAALAPIHAKSCPKPVKASIQDVYPDANLQSCKLKKSKGHEQYDAKLKGKNDEDISVTLDPQGSIIVTKEAMMVESVPGAVVTAFSAEHPDTKMDAAARQIDSAGVVIYEIAFKDEGRNKDAYYNLDGQKAKDEMPETRND